MSTTDTFGPLTNYEDVAAFHEKFGLIYDGPYRLLDPEMQAFRIKFMHEELAEYVSASMTDDHVGMADALVDLVYVVMGTAYLHGYPWQNLWQEVQRANLTKERAHRAMQSKRGTSLDVIKPEGWRGPDIVRVLEEAGRARN